MAEGPASKMVDAVVRCTVCKAPGYPPTCGCWTRCPCGWLYRTGEACERCPEAEGATDAEASK